MAERFVADIAKRGIQIITQAEAYPTSSSEKWWLIYFLGKEIDELVYNQNKIPDEKIVLWEVEIDPEGSDAKTVHDTMVELLKKGEPFEEVYRKVDALVETIQSKQ